MIKVSQQHLNDEEEHDEDLVLVSVTYVGSHQTYTDNAVRTQGYWPSYGGFTRGVAEVAFVPDRGLGYYENRSDFEVSYAKEDIAEAMLERNYLAPEVFSTGAGGGEVRRRVLDKLGIQALETTSDGIREQLRGVAGVEGDDDEGSSTLAETLANPTDGYTRSELKAAVSELREGPDEVSLQQGKTDFAEWLAGRVDPDDDDAMTQGELIEVIEGDDE